MARQPILRTKRDILEWCMTQIPKNKNGGYDETLIKPLYISKMPPVNVDQINEIRFNRDMEQLGAISDPKTAKFTRYGFFYNDDYLHENTNRIVRDNNGFVYRYMEAPPRALNDEDDRVQENTKKQVAAANQSTAKRKARTEWEMKCRAERWKDEDIIMANFHKEYPLMDDQNEQVA